VGLRTLPASVSRSSRQCGILNISERYMPPRPVTGRDLLPLARRMMPFLMKRCFHIKQGSITNLALSQRDVSAHPLFMTSRSSSVTQVTTLRAGPSRELGHEFPSSLALVFLSVAFGAHPVSCQYSDCGGGGGPCGSNIVWA
jgi:hypothetical protein